MQGKIRYELEVENFRRVFSDKRHMRIALYGTGQKTATLMAGLTDFRIIGLLDRDESLIGKEMYGVRVISREEAKENADLIVINTTTGYWETIYRRIQDWGIPVYYLTGVRAFVKNERFESSPYWEKNLPQLRKAISEHDIISFDVFDTLLMRRIHLPVDLFRLVERRINLFFERETNFFEYRSRAAHFLKEPGLDEIYAKMRELTGWDDTSLSWMKECEIRTDMELLVPRADMIELFHEAQRSKVAYLISDMYYPREVMQKMLGLHGIAVDDEHLVLSHEMQMSKKDGDLWEYYARKFSHDSSALHIGDDETSDVEQPRKVGIDAYHVWSAWNMMEHSEMGDLAPQIASLYASISMGFIQAKLFNSPFALHESKGKITFHDAWETGYCVLGSIAYSFLVWLARKARKDNLDQLIFLGRDGYLMVEQYRFLERLVKEQIPEGKYLEISRRSIGNAAAEDESDIYKIGMEPYLGNLRDFLHDRFGISVSVNEKKSVEVAEFQKSKAGMETLLAPYMESIQRQIKKEKKGYLRYLESMGMKENIGIVDTFRYGSCQYYLEQLTGRKFKGYFFCLYIAPENRYYRQGSMDACFQRKGDITGEKTELFRHSMFTEGFYTAPYGMLLYVKENGEKVHAKKMQNQTHFHTRIEMQKGILQFMQDMIELQGTCKLDNLLVDAEFADACFGCILDSKPNMAESIKKGFFYDNGLLHRKEYPVWE